MAILDDLLNGITMYRLMLYGLATLAGVALFFGFTGAIAYPATQLLASLGVLLGVCYVSNKLLAIITDAATNTESSLITALILWFIMPPSLTLLGLSELALAGLLAMASKYIFAWHRKHVFNPAAIAPVIMGLAGLEGASWWIGNKSMLPAVVVLGLLVVRKIRRFQIVALFTLVSVACIVLAGGHGQSQLSLFAGAFTSWPIVFMGTIMLTEPSTMPPRRIWQLLYAIGVAMVLTTHHHFGPVLSTPELALALGNIGSFIVSPKFNLKLTLREKRRISSRVWDYIFEPDRHPRFTPGQFMEWTLPHHHTDGRGNRRTFTIASSPTEKAVHLGFKTYDPSSSFKTALSGMNPGDSLIAGQINGSFTLPEDPAVKLLFIAGGIGITPFRSMLKYLIDTNDARDVVLIYAVANRSELSYMEIFEAAEKFGAHILTLTGSKQPTIEQIRAAVPDYDARHIYISGPEAMVRSWRNLLRSGGVRARQIKTDHFSGY